MFVPNPSRYSGYVFVSLGLLLCASGCRTEVRAPDPLAALREGGELVILTRNAPTTYYEGRDGITGFEYELATAFAESLGLTPRFEILETTADIFAAIEAGEGHIAAAGLTRTPTRQARFQFGPPYLKVAQKVVCGRGIRLPREVEELTDVSLMVVADTSYEERLRELQAETVALTWTATHEMETEQLIYLVWSGEVDCTVADSLIIDLERRYYPELRLAMSISGEEQLGWVVSEEVSPLVAELMTWFAAEEQQQLLEELRERHFGHVQIFDYVDLKVFQRRIEHRLPKYEPYFRKAADKHGFDWRLLAAQAYQESHWEPHARSPTGVRGIMMLTRQTAGQVGVFDRLDPRASIAGGARYLAGIHARLPDAIVEPDRTWIALAAYNVGYGHVMDARSLARKRDLDPDRWHHLREVLPLLSQRKYYRQLKHGYARGREPVRYVQRIRNFYDLLANGRRDEMHIASD